jgi:hypothetical protein
MWTKEYRRAWRAKNPEKVKAQKRRARERKALENPKKPHARTSVKKHSREARLRAHGWTEEMFQQTLKEQGNVCGLCRQPFTEQNPARADHKHNNPPEPRGILHSTCNAGLGQFRESPELCRAAAEYLEVWSV